MKVVYCSPESALPSIENEQRVTLILTSNDFDDKKKNANVNKTLDSRK